MKNKKTPVQSPDRADQGNCTGVFYDFRTGNGNRNVSEYFRPFQTNRKSDVERLILRRKPGADDHQEQGGNKDHPPALSSER
jgi:hypothetical protein